MSLADQSQQWYPTSVQVTVLQARNLRIKGKNGTNDAYAIMQVAKEKFATSVVEKTVSPMWKEEATFDLQLFHHGNTERCTLHVNVMHRALVGPDKLLGQAVVNLLELNAIQSRSKTEWFQLLDKAGKPDKDRGEVLVDIQFMRNNMTASMFDLSATDKPRSRLGKLKDKVRGKKKEGLSDSASAVVPAFTKVLTDSEGEGELEGDGAADKEGKKKKKHKLKSLFSTKSNLQRNVSQSMSVLGPLPERNSSLTGSRSSGLNIDSSEGKKKFKFLTHKRTGSSDSKGSQGSTSILGRSRQASTSSADQSNLCINGSHVYTEEPQPRSSRAGSTFSLASSGHGSMEDLRRYQGRKSSVDSLKAGKQSFPWEEESIGDREEQEEEGVELERERMRVEQLLRRKLLDEEQRVTEEEQKRVRELEEEDRMRRLEEEESIRSIEQERRRLEEEEKMKEERERGEEKERIRREEEDKIKIKEQERKRVKEENRRIEEEERIRKEQDQRKVLEDAEKIRLEEEERAAEERKKTFMEEEARRVRQEREEEEEKIREQERLFEEDRKKKEEELLRREEEARMERADRLRGEMEERKHDEEQRIRREEEDKLRAEEDERKTREQQRLEREMEEKRKEERESVIRLEEERSKEEESRKFEEKSRKEQEEKRRAEDQKMRGMEERERARLEDERRKEANLEKERRMREEEEGEPQEQEKIRLAVAEKRMVLQDREGEALVGKNPFEEVPSEDPFEDISTTNPFEEPSTAHSTEPLNRTTKISAVKPRPHPVKPLNSSEQQPVSNIQGGQPEKSKAISGSIQEKIKVQEPGVKGPYSQLTQEELISLVVKQQKQLGDRDKKIKELEQYIDNLLVRVIEEAPCILMSLNSPKP
ncbi:rab11 family-interacting protein 1 isoform X2 [Osmerus eperlanus]|uniref:rab11 family-interacting protein 1 isoform X2 n=1 Tax=Osmerus eperlanus TaxID=29151 RepID=UPI002E0FE916